MGKDNSEIVNKMIARAWKEEAFRDLFKTNPKAAFKEYGIEFPENVNVKVVSDDQKHAYFVFPQMPSKSKDMSLEELENLAAARCPHSISCIY